MPGGGDAYVMSNFLVIWKDDQAVIPLRNCRNAIGRSGKLLLVEWVMPAGGEPQEGFGFRDTVAADLMIFGIWKRGRPRVDPLGISRFARRGGVRDEIYGPDTRLSQRD